MDKSIVIDGYTVFVEKVREYLANNDEAAVSHAVDYCIANGVLDDFFSRNKSEVIKNMTIDMTFERRIELATRDSYNNGIAKGIEKGIEKGNSLVLINIVIKKVKKQKSLDTVADEMEENIDYIRPIYDAVVDNPNMDAEGIYNILQGDK